MHFTLDKVARRGGAEDGQTVEEERCVLEENEQRDEMNVKMPILKILPRSRQQRNLLKQEQVETEGR